MKQVMVMMGASFVTIFCTLAVPNLWDKGEKNLAFLCATIAVIAALVVAVYWVKAFRKE